jgi:hypothetical protein
MTVETRPTTPHNQLFLIEEEGSNSVAELLESAARWVRNHDGISVVDLSLHLVGVSPEDNELELNIYYE